MQLWRRGASMNCSIPFESAAGFSGQLLALHQVEPAHPTLGRDRWAMVNRWPQAYGGLGVVANRLRKNPGGTATLGCASPESRCVTRASERKDSEIQPTRSAVLLTAFAGCTFAQTRFSVTLKCGEAVFSQPRSKSAISRPPVDGFEDVLYPQQVDRDSRTETDDP
jgi:hypothetical protein